MSRVVMKFMTVSLRTQNAAFWPDPNQEAARILRDLADKLEAGHHFTAVRDINGNVAGVVQYEYEEAEEE